MSSQQVLKKRHRFLFMNLFQIVLPTLLYIHVQGCGGSGVVGSGGKGGSEEETVPLIAAAETPSGGVGGGAQAAETPGLHDSVMGGGAGKLSPSPDGEQVRKFVFCPD